MIEIPFRAEFEGTTDCSFDIKHISCECKH